MKKLLLCVTAAAMFFGCGKSMPEDQIQEDLSKYDAACSVVAFKGTRAQLDEINKLVDANAEPAEIEKARNKAQDLYNSELIRYNDLKAENDKAAAQIQNQKTRVRQVEEAAAKSNPKEAEKGIKRINDLHADAEKKLANCDAAGAERSINQAEREVARLEALYGINSKPVTTTGGSYTVKKGDCLWSIASNKYSNPYFWPLIYWANQSSIKDPDLIYPNQKLTIDSSASSSKKSEAEKFARTRGAWSLYDNK